MRCRPQRQFAIWCLRQDRLGFLEIDFLLYIANIYIYNDPGNDEIRINFDCPAFCIDRIVEFWTSTNLIVKKERNITLSDASSDTVMLDDDSSASLTTLEALVHMCLCALDLEDDALTEATLSRIRHHIIDGKFLTHEELLKCTDFAYDKEGDTESHKVLRQVLLSAVVLHTMDIWMGSCREMLVNLRKKHPQFDFDHFTGSLYYTTVYKDLDWEDSGESEKETSS